MIVLLRMHFAPRSFALIAAFFLALIWVPSIAADDNPGIATIYATTTPTSNGLTLMGINVDGSLILGMSENQLLGITASGMRGITASGLRGITASGMRGITASGLRGITASGMR